MRDYSQGLHFFFSIFFLFTGRLFVGRGVEFSKENRNPMGRAHILGEKKMVPALGANRSENERNRRSFRSSLVSVQERGRTKETYRGATQGLSHADEGCKALPRLRPGRHFKYK